MVKSPISKIGLILLLIFLLPAIFYSAYEISHRNQSEEMIREIYTKQLDAILYSVNQYSSDVANGWASKINLMLKISDEPEDTVKLVLNEFLGVRNIFFADSIDGEDILVINNPEYPGYANAPSRIKTFLNGSSEKIARLYTYREGGFRKVEPFGNSILNNHSGDEETVFIFLLDEGTSDYTICGVALDPNIFINQVLSPKMQSIAGEEFILTATDLQADSLVYATVDSVAADDARQKPFWLLPDYNLGIKLQGKTIDELVKERFSTNLGLILALNVVLILAVWFVYRNVKKEIQLAQAKSDFVSNVSHEIRTPLSLISMYAETLEMDRIKEESKKKEYYSVITQETGRLANIVNKILNFSQVEADNKRYDFEELDLNTQVSSILKTYDSHLKSKGFQYHFAADHIIPRVRADREAVSEAIINIVDNAIKYSGDKKNINIKTGKSNGYSYVEISDQGIGISKSNLKHIFNKFYRVTSGAVHNTKGTGLGLSLVKHIMDAHEGRVEVESELDVGSTFRLSFPF
ncbi:MAG: ATP-binding protein [Bacteroidota bacterium]